MKNKKNLTNSIISISSSFVLLVCVCIVWFKSFAWTTDNPKASAGNIIATTTTSSVKSLTLKAYYLTKESEQESSYVIEKEVQTVDGLMSMYDYNDVDHLYTAVLLEISYEVYEAGVYELSLANTTNYIYKENVELAVFTKNALSNAIFIADALKDESNYSYQNEDKKSFLSGTDSYSKETRIKLSELDIESTGKSYFILDYSEVNINYLYNELINIYPDADLTTEIDFGNDLQIILAKK